MTVLSYHLRLTSAQRSERNTARTRIYYFLKLIFFTQNKNLREGFEPPSGGLSIHALNVRTASDDRYTNRGRDDTIVRKPLLITHDSMARTLRPAPTNCTPVARQSALSAGACSCARTCAHLNLLPPSHTHRLAPCACTFFPPLPTPRPLSLSPQPPPSLCLPLPLHSDARSLARRPPRCGPQLSALRTRRVAPLVCLRLSLSQVSTNRTDHPTYADVSQPRGAAVILRVPSASWPPAGAWHRSCCWCTFAGAVVATPP
jgi:hypothetical protein